MGIRLPQEIIAKKRDGGELSAAEIAEFIDGVCDKSWADYQIAALVMAIFTRGMNEAEQSALTRAMLHSGEILDLSDIDAPKADKHSTGGVGDKTSIIIAPLVAACGVVVPMVSGRGLGHTGGTLDKLESIAGYNVNLSTTEFKRVILECGFAMAGQTAEIAPADRKLYALRDATATVPYIPLIVGSIMSKKLAEGLGALVLDVKTGSGAFMSDPGDSIRLAEALVRTGSDFDIRSQAVISDMSQPLGRFAGNAVEVYECIKILRGECEAGMAATCELSLELSARMLFLSGVDASLETCRSIAESKLSDGSALERLRKNIQIQGGDPSVCDRPQAVLHTGVLKFDVHASAVGTVAKIDTFAVGRAISDLGGGRVRADDKVDPAVGIEMLAVLGQTVETGQPLCTVYARDEATGRSAVEKLLRSIEISETAVEVPNLIQTVVG